MRLQFDKVKWGNLLAFALSAFVCILLLTLFEFTFYILNQQKLKALDLSRKREPEYLQRHSLYGVAPKASMRSRDTRHEGGKQVFDVHYTFDEKGRRDTPSTHPTVAKERFLLFFGCSFTFGTGVEDAQTLPYYVSEKLPKQQVYNYAFQGHGPQQLLAKLESETLSAELKETSGTLVYVLIPDHVRRVIGSMKVTRNWPYGGDYPCYGYDEWGEVKKLGTFASARPWRHFFYGVLNKEQCLNYFGRDWPLALNSTDVTLSVDVLHKAATLFKAQFPDSRFLVLLYPGDIRNSGQNVKSADFLEPLQAKGLDFIDASEVVNFDTPGYAIEGDGHPTPKAHAEVAAFFVGALGEQDIEEIGDNGLGTKKEEAGYVR